MEKGTRPLFYVAELCPVRHVLDGIGDKWTIHVLTGLKLRDQRFSELKRQIPDISQRMLTQTLRNLERDGLVSRDVTPSIPPRVDYALTDLGRSLTDQLAPLAHWALTHLPVITSARRAFDTRAPV